jgi:hypothetical protein
VQPVLGGSRLPRPSCCSDQNYYYYDDDDADYRHRCPLLIWFVFIMIMMSVIPAVRTASGRLPGRIKAVKQIGLALTQSPSNNNK